MSQIRTRVRSYNEAHFVYPDQFGRMPIAGQIQTVYPSNPSWHSEYPWYMVGTTLQETTESCTDQTNARLSGGRWSGGGRLSIHKDEKLFDTCGLSISGLMIGKERMDAGGQVRATMHLSTRVAYSSYAGIPAADALSTESYGARAWNKYKPGKPNAGLTVFLAEIRDVPRTARDACQFMKNLWKGRRLTPKGLGKDYITYQFGMAPLVRDVIKMIDLAQTVDRRITDLRRLNGQWIKRGGTVHSEESQLWKGDLVDAYMFDFLPSTAATPPGSCGSSGTVRHTKKVWFSGRFRYFIPELAIEGSTPQLANLKRKMAGLSITPEAIWELMPWSWFADYFLHIDDLLSNLDNGVVSECAAAYAYVMCTSEVCARQESWASLKNGNYLSGSAIRRSVTKTRSPASPFGFGLSGDLSSGQLAILAGLGLSHT